jgi:hypothetical protein
MRNKLSVEDDVPVDSETHVVISSILRPDRRLDLSGVLIGLGVCACVHSKGCVYARVCECPCLYSVFQQKIFFSRLV